MKTFIIGCTNPTCEAESEKKFIDRVHAEEYVINTKCAICLSDDWPLLVFPKLHRD